ncbi:MAG: hypothetical protein K6G60_06075 [Lachnospiraceae bacterium]|nr:hypothetical protein [Lachnospiraceae bacterium]
MRARRIRDIVIELTSLLDVVMILIFAVMIENSKMVKASEAEVLLANQALEEMQDELDESAAEQVRLTEEYTAKLQEAETAINLRDDEIAKKEEELADKKEELDKAGEAYARLSDEKDAISQDLKIANQKLSEGDVEELLGRIANSEKKLESYEYLKQVVGVYAIGVESVLDPSDEETYLYSILSYGKAGTTAEDRKRDFRNNSERLEAIAEMRTALVEGIDRILKTEDSLVYVVFSYHEYKTRATDKRAVAEALAELSERYNDRVFYKTNKIMEE